MGESIGRGRNYRRTALPTVNPDHIRWPPPHRLAWAFTGQFDGLEALQALGALAEAWNLWAGVCGIKPTFTSEWEAANVLITTSEIHGAYTSLANSDLYDGRQHYRIVFNRNNPWVIAETPERGKIDLVRVAAHEIGHVLGIRHPPEGIDCLMAEKYSARVRSPQEWDIARAVEFYGEAE